MTDPLGVCPAAISSEFDGINRGDRGGRFCWAIAGTLCDGKVQGISDVKLSSCLDCAFLQQVRDEEGVAFKLTPADVGNGAGREEVGTGKEIATIARKIFFFMIKKDIPITPENYKVWFEYNIGGNEALEEDIREKTLRGARLNEQLTEYLYNQYFGDPDRKRIISLAVSHTTKILKDIIDHVLISNAHTTEYNGKLKQYAMNLSDVTDLKEVQGIIKNIINDTKKAEESNRDLQNKLKKITHETENLKKEIVQKEKDLLKDPLTGLYNRRALQRKSKELCADFRANGSLFSAIMIDINKFKQFNDEYGHMIGDEALQIVSTTLEENTKGKDFVGRYGGDEFIVLLPMTPLYSALILAENLRRAVAEKKLKYKSTGKTLAQITISLGVSQIHPEDTIESILARADSALLSAKSTPCASVKSERDCR
jgi:diguanylate cyclase